MPINSKDLDFDNFGGCSFLSPALRSTEKIESPVIINSQAECLWSTGFAAKRQDLVGRHTGEIGSSEQYGEPAFDQTSQFCTESSPELGVMTEKPLPLLVGETDAQEQTTKIVSRRETIVCPFDELVKTELTGVRRLKLDGCPRVSKFVSIGDARIIMIPDVQTQFQSTIF